MTELSARPWHAEEVDAVAATLEVDPARGLTGADATERLARHGENRLESRARTGLVKLVLNQFTDFMVLVLIVAALVSAALGETTDSIVIIVIVVLNAVIGVVQEIRAERALEALEQITTPQCRMRRDGQAMHLPTEELVPGDVVLLEAGGLVPADLRLTEAVELSVDESALTGESTSVRKHGGAPVAEDAIVQERTSMAYRGTLVRTGHALGIAVGTGMATEIGRIATLMQERERPRTPLQRRLNLFGKRLSVGVLVVCALIFFAGVTRGEPVLLMFMTSVSLAVAAVPEALPAVVTITLALGAQQMAARRALIRRLPAVETLGSVTVICADKTGTLTENRMRAERFVTAEESLSALPGADAAEPWQTLKLAMVLNNDSEFEADGTLAGDPTETALLVAAADAGIDTRAVVEAYPRRAELPFDSVRKLMATWHNADGAAIAYIKGAPEAVLALTPPGAARDALIERAHALAADGYRVLAFATAQADAAPADGALDGLEARFLALVGLHDPPRQEVPDAVRAARNAGIVPVLITGDHPATAQAIAKQVGFVEDGHLPLTGPDLVKRRENGDGLSDLSETRVYARVSPEQKIDIVTALQEQGEIVAMTGDGVNDAPALKRADIGVAMGLRGTDVAREAADMVLLDDNFATIVAAIREGRRIYDNIRKFIKYTMTSNAGEIWTIALAPLFGLPLPLLPIQILWINLVTDGLPGLGFSFEQEERGTMRRPPRPPSESLFARGVWQYMLVIGLLIGGLSLAAQALTFYGGSENWQTAVFTTLTLAQLVNALSLRSERQSLFSMAFMGNRFMIFAVVLTCLLQMAVVYLPPLQILFHTTPLSAGELALCFALASVVLVVTEVEKWMARRGWTYRA